MAIDRCAWASWRLAGSESVRAGWMSYVGRLWQRISDDLFDPKEALSDYDSANCDADQVQRLLTLAAFHPQWVNADFDLCELVHGLKRSGSGMLCLYGPPGTGKSAFGAWLAGELGMPLMVKRGADLIHSEWGQTERNIALAFAQAESSHSVLLIDEVEGFLLDRRGANRRWEITEVNQMLTEMEQFSGIFVATTNMLDSLDQAALRRFDLKVKLDCLTPLHAREYFLHYCQAMEYEPPSDVELSEVMCLRALTLGDFATVTRQQKFRPVANSGELLAALRRESALKEGNQRAPMGFL